MRTKERIIQNQKKIISVMSLIILFIGIVIFGVTLNTLVQKNNNGKMPVKISIIYDGVYSFSDESHFSYTNESQIKYPILSDRYDVIFGTASLGDFVMFIGSLVTLSLIIYNVILLKRNKKYETNIL